MRKLALICSSERFAPGIMQSGYRGHVTDEY